MAPSFKWTSPSINQGKQISVFLQDPKNNRIEQWLNVVPQEGIADLSFQLSDEPLLGTYVINVTNRKIYDSFTVEEYVLPKFEVIFEAPVKIYALDKTFPLRVCGRYTYGKAVQGMVYVSLCQKISQFLPSASKPDLCQEFYNQVNCLAGAENYSVTVLVSPRLTQGCWSVS